MHVTCACCFCAFTRLLCRTARLQTGEPAWVLLFSDSVPCATITKSFSNENMGDIKSDEGAAGGRAAVSSTTSNASTSVQEHHRTIVLNSSIPRQRLSEQLQAKHEAQTISTNINSQPNTNQIFQKRPSIRKILVTREQQEELCFDFKDIISWARLF